MEIEKVMIQQRKFKDTKTYRGIWNLDKKENKRSFYV